MSGANFNDTDRKAERHNSIVTIRKESDFPTPILAPDGIMRIPLDITTSYVFDLGELEISTPFLMPERLLGLERVRMQSFTNTTFIYTGADEPLFFGRNAGALESDKVDWVSQTPGKKCFDMVSGFGLVSITIFNTAFLDWDMGFLSGFAIFGRRFGMVRPRGALRLHNVTRVFIDNLRFVTPPGGNANPNFILTGGDNLANPKFENTLVQLMLAGQSFFSVDKGSSYPQVGFENIPFDGIAGTFFETDLSGSLSAMAALSSLIIGSVTAYEQYLNDGTNFTLVTDVGHDVYVGLTVNHTDTTFYNGIHIVTRVLGLNQYVMDKLYVTDEFSGNYTGVGTRITTTLPHKLTDHRTTDITGTTNYNGTGQEVLNVTSITFDIIKLFMGNDATGNYLTQSLDQTDVNVLAENNGALPVSKKVGEVDLAPVIPLVVGGSNAQYAQINGIDWTASSLEEFTSTSAGVLTYIGLNPATFTIIGTATIINTGGPASILGMRIAKGGVTIASSEGTTQNGTPTQVTSLAVVDLNPGEDVSLFVSHITGGDTVTVNQATLLVSGIK